jgi:hypothetical protein
VAPAQLPNDGVTSVLVKLARLYRVIAALAVILEIFLL